MQILSPGSSLTSADEQGDGIEALARAASTIKLLTEQLPDLHTEESACELEARDLATLAETINAKDAEAASLRTQTATAQAEEGRLATAASAASELLTEARAELAAARNCAAVYSDRQKAVKEVAERKSKAAAAIEPAATAVRAATETVNASKDAREAIQRANAAAHAAEGCEPGDPCPVCQRPLPADFAMLAPPGKTDADAKLKAAEHAAVQVFGEKRASLDRLGWQEALVTYRPFLSHSELEAFLSGPSHLYDLLSSVLGLEDLTAAEQRRNAARKEREDGLKKVNADLPELLDHLDSVDDERASS